jgi:2'-5' RNA ligase superfamily
MSTLTRHHVTAFMDPAVSGPVEELRRRWDPQMAAQIAAHVTVIYPEEIPGPARLQERAAAAAAETAPFDLETGPAFCDGPPSGGVFLRIHDPDGGLRAFRAAAIPAGRAISFPPHLTRPGPSWPPAASPSGSPSPAWSSPQPTATAGPQCTISASPPPARR